MARGAAPIKFVIWADGVEDQKIKFAKLESLMSNYNEPLRRSEKYVRRKTADRFRAQNWKPLAPSTVRRKGFSTILVETGQMRRAANSSAHSVITRDTATLKVPIKYAHFHQTGTKRMPQRKFFLVLPEEERQIALFFKAYLREGM